MPTITSYNRNTINNNIKTEGVERAHLGELDILTLVCGLSIGGALAMILQKKMTSVIQPLNNSQKADIAKKNKWEEEKQQMWNDGNQKRKKQVAQLSKQQEDLDDKWTSERSSIKIDIATIAKLIDQNKTNAEQLIQIHNDWNQKEITSFQKQYRKDSAFHTNNMHNITAQFQKDVANIDNNSTQQRERLCYEQYQFNQLRAATELNLLAQEKKLSKAIKKIAKHE